MHSVTERKTPINTRLLFFDDEFVNYDRINEEWLYE